MEEMGVLYNFLGLTTGCIIHGITPQQRREAYGCDITYGTNNEFGFDYLRDNMVIHMADRVQRELNLCIVDEVDSILIDEARTPLIISGMGDKSTKFYNVADNFVKTLINEKDFKTYSKFVKALFQHRNKKVKNALIDSRHIITDLDKKEMKAKLNSIKQKKIEELLSERITNLTPEEILYLSIHLNSVLEK